MLEVIRGRIGCKFRICHVDSGYGTFLPFSFSFSFPIATIVLMDATNGAMPLLISSICSCQMTCTDVRGFPDASPSLICFCRLSWQYLHESWFDISMMRCFANSKSGIILGSALWSLPYSWIIIWSQRTTLSPLQLFPMICCFMAMVVRLFAGLYSFCSANHAVWAFRHPCTTYSFWTGTAFTMVANVFLSPSS